MKTLKKVSLTMLMFIIITSFSNCSSAQKLQDKSPLSFDAIYYQNWVAGVQGGGSGLNLFFPVKSNLKNIKLDSVYFRNKRVKLETKPQNELLYIGRFNGESNKKENIILSSDSNAEYGNTAPIIPQKMPFEINDNECVVSYLDGNTIKYFKISNITKKESVHYPSAPPRKP